MTLQWAKEGEKKNSQEVRWELWNPVKATKYPHSLWSRQNGAASTGPSFLPHSSPAEDESSYLNWNRGKKKQWRFYAQSLAASPRRSFNPDNKELLCLLRLSYLTIVCLSTCGFAELWPSASGSALALNQWPLGGWHDRSYTYSFEALNQSESAS